MPGKINYKEDLLELPERIGEFVNMKISVYVLGGAALTLRDIKPSTVDIGITVEDQASYEALVSALERLGFVHESGLRFRNIITDEYVDVDVGKFIRLPLYPEFKQDAQLLGVFGNMEVLLFSNESVILLKSITGRERDLEDIATIIRSGDLSWERLLQKAVSITDKELAEKGAKGVLLVFELLVALDRVNEENPGLVPGDFLDRLEKIAGEYYKIWAQRAGVNKARHYSAYLEKAGEDGRPIKQ